MANTRRFNIAPDTWQHVATGGGAVSIQTKSFAALEAYVGPELGPEGTSEAMSISRHGAVFKGIGDEDRVYVRSDLMAMVEVGVGIDYQPLPPA